MRGFGPQMDPGPGSPAPLAWDRIQQFPQVGGS